MGTVILFVTACAVALVSLFVAVRTRRSLSTTDAIHDHEWRGVRARLNEIERRQDSLASVRPVQRDAALAQCAHAKQQPVQHTPKE